MNIFDGAPIVIFTDTNDNKLEPVKTDMNELVQHRFEKELESIGKYANRSFLYFDYVEMIRLICMNTCPDMRKDIFNKWVPVETDQADLCADYLKRKRITL